MARLSSYYTLCPLIDQQNLLGVEPDSDPGCAIVTLGRNIIIRYKLQDLKQVSSWSSKERLTTQVIFDDLSNNYVAIFNGKNVRIWQEQEKNLDNVKKFKFLIPVFTILSLKNISPILVMQNGATSSLEWALKHRKELNSPGILLPEEKILSCQLICVKNKTYLCALTVLEQVNYYIMVLLKKDNFMEDLDQINRIELKRSAEQLISHVIIQDNINASLLTLWSHGRLYSYSLTDPATKAVPGSIVSVITVVNTKYPVVMVALNETTFAAYGADAHEEGAVLFIYNVQFKLVQAIQKLKLFTNDAKLWRIDEKLLLAANRHLAVAPYSLAPQKLESILGSTLHLKIENCSKDNDIVVIQESTIADWGCSNIISPEKCNDEVPLNNLKSQIATQVSTLLREGMSDAAIHYNLIPKLIEAKDIPSILWCLDNLKDLPEELLMQLLVFCLKMSYDFTILSQNEFMNDTNHEKSENFEIDFLNKILSTCYSDVPLIFHLRSGLNFDDTIKLLNYLIYKLNNESFLINNLGSDYKINNQTCKWTKLLIDSHYQHYLLSRDKKVLKLLNQLNETLEKHLEFIKKLGGLRPLINRLIEGKLLKSVPNDVNRFYSIEEIKLY